MNIDKLGTNGHIFQEVLSRQQLMFSVFHKQLPISAQMNSIKFPTYLSFVFGTFE